MGIYKLLRRTRKHLTSNVLRFTSTDYRKKAKLKKIRELERLNNNNVIKNICQAKIDTFESSFYSDKSSKINSNKIVDCLNSLENVRVKKSKRLNNLIT